MSMFNCKVKNIVSGRPVEEKSLIGVNYYLINTVHKYKVPITEKVFYEYSNKHKKWVKWINT